MWRISAAYKRFNVPDTLLGDMLSGGGHDHEWNMQQNGNAHAAVHTHLTSLPPVLDPTCGIGGGEV